MKTNEDEDRENHFRARSVGEVLEEWPHMHYLYIAEVREVIFRGIWPPINAMDSSLELLEECVILSLSKNMIEKISGLIGLRNLKVLSLAQNNIKSLKGLEDAGNTLEVLIIARNFLKETEGIEDLYKLKELDISYNYINQLNEFTRIGSCKDLKSLAFKENPLATKYPDNIWREEALKLLPQLETFDYIKVEENEKYFNPPTSEFFKMKEDILFKSPEYKVYNDMFKEAEEEILKLKNIETDYEEVCSSDTSLST
ncbi:dynein axonemal light chain 1 [Halyomorpha halys]|uniref:dynein axonemal light chain 1 n=1 Tax=Halyomorpha halys TaxID=286706 RepID=UPI0006D4DBEA|nr:dynein light chain 1, axonemal [Halyomorpha halys]